MPCVTLVGICWQRVVFACAKPCIIVVYKFKSPISHTIKWGLGLRPPRAAGGARVAAGARAGGDKKKRCAECAKESRRPLTYIYFPRVVLRDGSPNGYVVILPKTEPTLSRVGLGISVWDTTYLSTSALRSVASRGAIPARPRA